jgi:hypothetical protein
MLPSQLWKASAGPVRRSWMSGCGRRVLWVALQAERARVVARGRQIETESAPIRYVTAVFGVTDSETAIRWLILMMVLTCDPLALALTAAASARR